MVFVRRPHLPSLEVHSESSCSDAGKGVIPCTAQKWTKSFLGVVYVRRGWELSPHQRYRVAWGGGCSVLTRCLECHLILQAVDSGVQVQSACSTAYISSKLMYLVLCCCGTVELKSWAGVCMLDRVSLGLRK